MKTTLLAALLWLAGAAAAAAQTELLVVSGLSGEPHYAAQFNKWGASLVDAARTRYGLRADQVIWLAETPASDPSGSPAPPRATMWRRPSASSRGAPGPRTG